MYYRNIYSKKAHVEVISLINEKVIDQDYDIKEVVIWIVPMNDLHPEGVRYRLAFIPKGHDRPAVLYDNHHPKSHHKHLMDTEHPYHYGGIPRLLEDFYRDILQWKRKWRLLQ